MLSVWGTLMCVKSSFWIVFHSCRLLNFIYPQSTRAMMHAVYVSFSDFSIRIYISIAARWNFNNFIAKRNEKLFRFLKCFDYYIISFFSGKFLLTSNGYIAHDSKHLIDNNFENTNKSSKISNHLYFWPLKGLIKV